MANGPMSVFYCFMVAFDVGWCTEYGIRQYVVCLSLHMVAQFQYLCAEVQCLHQMALPPLLHRAMSGYFSVLSRSIQSRDGCKLQG